MTAVLLVHKLSYLGTFVFLAGAGIFAPIPEEVTLLTVGYLSALGIMDFWLAVPLSMAGILIGDTILFSLARFGATYARKIHDRLLASGLHRTWIFDPDHPLRSVFFLRFVTGLRMIAPIFAGFNEASWAGFLLTNLAALVIFVPLVMGLGWYFHANFFAFLAGFEVLRHTLFITIALLVGGSVLAAMSPHLHKVVERLRTRKKGGGENHEPRP
jgi:membrane protein DedA with SNARE-associated domain